MGNNLLIRLRLREAVAASAEPQLQRSQDDDLREGAPSQDAFPDGSFPITTQKQAGDAWDLRGHNENHSEESIVAHIRKQAKKHGLTMPGDKTRESESVQLLLREATAVRKTGDAYEVTIVREGPGNPGDRNYYTSQALRQAVTARKFEGLQAYLNHPTATEERERPERDVRFLAGHFREARFIDGNPAEVRAKFLPGGMDKDRVVALIESALASPQDKPLIGISIDGYGHAPDTQDINGRTYNMVREVTHLGSADIVTRAGAGGQFHRRLQEAWRNTGPAERRPDTSKEAPMKPAQMQERMKAAVAKLTEAAALKDDDTKAELLLNESVSALRECSTAELELPEPEVRIQEKIVEKPVSAGDSDADKLAVKLQETETRLQTAVSAREQAEKDQRDARDELSTLQCANLAANVLREAKVPEGSARAWFDDVAGCDDKDQMVRLVERKKDERESILAEFRESLGVEGAGPRNPSTPASGNGSGGLLERVGIDRDELAA